MITHTHTHTTTRTSSSSSAFVLTLAADVASLAELRSDLMLFLLMSDLRDLPPLRCELGTELDPIVLVYKAHDEEGAGSSRERANTTLSTQRSFICMLHVYGGFRVSNPYVDLFKCERNVFRPVKKASLVSRFQTSKLIRTIACSWPMGLLLPVIGA